MKNYLRSIIVFTGLFINKIISLNLHKIECNKNIQNLSCKNCKHFILDTDKVEQGKCDLTYITSLVTGKKFYNYAILNRMNVLSCGIDGKFYETPIINDENIIDNIPK
jgi:hypothetical protein